MKKKTLITGILCLLTLLTSALVLGTKLSHPSDVHGGEVCNHAGYHYEAHDATAWYGKHKEFWACCKCGEQFLEEPQTGSFETRDSRFMIGGLGTDHIAYDGVKSEFQQLSDELSIPGYSYVVDSTTNKIWLSKWNDGTWLPNVNADVLAALTTLQSETPADSEHIDATKLAAFKSLAQQKYVAHINNELKTLYTTYFGTVFNRGKLNSPDGYLGAGIKGYGNWVFVNQYFDTDDATKDQRWWTPSCWKPTGIINYAKALDTTKTIAQLTVEYENILLDAYISAGIMIMEAETYYATNSRAGGNLVIGGNASASEWWFLWSYAGTSGFSYTGHLNLTPSVGDFRLPKGMIMTEQGGPLDLATANLLVPYIINDQADDMFNNAI